LEAKVAAKVGHKEKDVGFTDGKDVPVFTKEGPTSNELVVTMVKE
jgi:hypothetical protein